MKVAKKVALLVFIVFLLTASLALAFAQTEEEETAAETVEAEKVALAYSWLSDQVKEGWPTSVEDNAFALLALAYDDKLAQEGRKALLDKKTDGGWKGIKQTALALLALDRLGEKTTEIENWLLNKSKTFEATNLEWLIQIELDGNTTCEISYGGKSESDEVTLNEDKTVKLDAKGTPKCLSVYREPFWLKISSDENCLKETYSFYCDDRVKGSLLYIKDKAWFIPSETKESNSFDLEIESICLAEGGKCDYEGTLWAAYALAKQGRDIDLLLPYLVAQADIEDKYLPYAFLYALTEDSGYADSLLALQDNKGYWYKMYKFYDTALAYLTLKDYAAADESLANAKKYLLGHQSTTGSWGDSIRDTAFILYAIRPLEVSPMPPENECTAHDYFCRTSCIEYGEEVEAEEYSDFCEENEMCCKPEEEVPTECSEEEHICCKECDPDFEVYTNYDESCGLNKVCCEKCAAVAVPKCEEKRYKCCVECDPNSLDYPDYDESCPGFARCCEKCAEEIEICDNKIDDNGNNLIDCDDPDCVAFEKCQPKSKLWLFILLSLAALIGLYLFLRKKGFRPSEFFKRKLFRRFKRPPRFGEQPAQVLGRPRPMVLLRRPFKKPQPIAKEKTETEEELEKTLSKLKKISE